MQKIIEQVKAYLDRTPDPCGADYLERGGTRKAILSLIDHERSNLVLLKPNQKTRSEMESLDQDIKRLGALRHVLEVEELRGKEAALETVEKYPDLLPELRSYLFGAEAEAARLAEEHGLDKREALAVEIVLLKNGGMTLEQIGGMLQTEGRLCRDCKPENLKRSVIAHRDKHLDAIERCGLP